LVVEASLATICSVFEATTELVEIVNVTLLDPGLIVTVAG
jgi:hypothetical protein